MMAEQTLAALLAFVTAPENRVVDAMFKRVPDFMSRHDCGHYFDPGDRRDFALRWRAIHRWRMTADYTAARLSQLVTADFRFWVYKTGASLGCPEHATWNGFAARPDHSVWLTHTPANGWTCDCYIVGTHLSSGIRRLGGDIDFPLPMGWDSPLSATGLPPGIESGFGSGVFPDMRVCLEALQQGHHLRLA